VEPILGQIQLFGFPFAPRGWAFCEGQMMSIAQNTALFALVGTTYGGDGRQTFALPDLREQEKPLGGARYCIALQGIFPARE
jgi:microcystin-dependent protein